MLSRSLLGAFAALAFCVPVGAQLPVPQFFDVDHVQGLMPAAHTIDGEPLGAQRLAQAFTQGAVILDEK